MSKVATKIANISTADSYQAYVKSLLELNLDLRGVSASNIKNGSIVREDNSEHISYKKYKKIIALFNIKSCVKLIHGFHIHISPLGYLFIGVFPRNPNKPRMNRGASFKLRRELESSGELTKENWKVYYTDDDFIKLTWHKQSAVRNIQFYRFVPAGGQPGKGFRQTMSREISTNPALKILYPFINKTELA